MLLRCLMCYREGCVIRPDIQGGTSQTTFKSVAIIPGKRLRLAVEFKVAIAIAIAMLAWAAFMFECVGAHFAVTGSQAEEGRPVMNPVAAVLF